VRRLIVCADDFGCDRAVNEAVEIAHRDGILSSASLMVGASATADAVALARRSTSLKVGLHLVLVDGAPVLPPGELQGLLARDGRFADDPLRAGLHYFFGIGVRRRLVAEIRAQFEAFRATGLALDHVNGHKHLQLHPTIARLAVEIGRDYGLRAMRVPDEPVAPLRCAFPGETRRPPPYRFAAQALRRRLQRVGIVSADHIFGVAWSGQMVEERVLALLPHLPDGVSELYFHPATGAAQRVPGYRHADELAALTSPAVRRRIGERGIGLTTYGELAR
jgi:hopanoid biosynthesis associated protein HpnK